MRKGLSRWKEADDTNCVYYRSFTLHKFLAVTAAYHYSVVMFTGLQSNLLESITPVSNEEMIFKWADILFPFLI